MLIFLNNIYEKWQKLLKSVLVVENPIFLFWEFWTLERLLQKKLFGSETSNLSFPWLVFFNIYSTFNKSDLYKTLMKLNGKFDEFYFYDKRPVIFYFLEIKNLWLYHWLMLKSVIELSYITRKTSVKISIFKNFQRALSSYWVVVRKRFLPCLETFKYTF